ncbi:MAG: outer membrane protein transport protein [Myxococcaceae bacterium]|nr:outer membrane protein transport protein [Myxococcaceae bacterium]
MKKTLSVATLLAAGLSHAAGFSIDTHSARATGLCSTANATMQDSSAIAYNPANILGVKKLDITAGDVVINPHLQFTPEGGSQQAFKPTYVPPPHAFAVYRLNEDMAAGIGVYVPFGAGANWPDDFVGRTRGLKSTVATYAFNPTFAYQAHDRFRVGVGLSLVRGTVDIRRKIALVQNEGTIQIGGAGWGFGYNAGIQVEVLEKLLSFGAQFRGPTKTNFDGKGDFQDVPAGFQTLLKDQNLKSTITLPGMVGLGLSFTPMERLTVGFDANLVLWSSIEEFAINFEDEALNNPLPKRWEDTWNFHLGAEYGVTESLFVRAGLAYDPSPSPEATLTPDLPDAHRYKAALGVGYAFNPFRVDVAYQGAILGDTKSTAPGIEGTYDGFGHSFGLTIGYSMQ